MKTYKSVLFWILLSLLLTMQTNANRMFYFTGTPQANTSAAPNFPDFQNWCQGTCAPTTQFPAIDAITGNQLGYVYVWGKNYKYSADMKTLCFTEFIEYKLQLGTIYTLGNTSGTCGAVLDPLLAHPISNPAASVIAGGGTGNIIGGTQFYQNTQGQYADRVFVEFLNGQINYYNELFLYLMTNDQ